MIDINLNHNELINLAFEACTQSQDSFIKQIVMTYVPTDSKSVFYTAKYPLKLTANSGIDTRRKFWSILFKNIFGQENKTLPNHFIRKHVPEGYFRSKDSKVRIATRQEMTELGLHEPATIYLITEIKPEAKVSARAYKGLQRKVTLLEKENRKLRKAVNSRLDKVDPIQYQAKDDLHPIVNVNTGTQNPAKLVKDLMREDAGADSNSSVSDDFINYLLGDVPKPVVEEDDQATDDSDLKSKNKHEDKHVSDEETEQFLEDLVSGNVSDTPENKKKADDIANHIADQIIDVFPELKSAVESDDKTVDPVDGIDRGGVVLDSLSTKEKYDTDKDLSDHHDQVNGIKHHETESLSDKFGKQIPAQSDHKSGKCDKYIDGSDAKSENKVNHADSAVSESEKAEFNKNMKALKNAQRAIDAVNQVGLDNDELTRRIDAIMSDPRTVKANNAVNDILKKYPSLAFSKDEEKADHPNLTDLESEKSDDEEAQPDNQRINDQRLQDVRDAIQKIFDSDNKSGNGIKHVVINVNPKNANLQSIIDMLFGRNEDSDLKSGK